MGNTVGSQRNLTQIEQDIVIGSLLGDGSMERNGRFIRLKIAHGLPQKQYLFWKYDQLKRIAFPPRFVEGAWHKKAERRYPRWEFATGSREALEVLWSYFYDKDTGRRIESSLPGELLTPRAFAIWVMDDGYKRNDCNAFRLNTDSFSVEEQEFLMSIIHENFSIRGRLHRKGKNWNIYIPQKEADALRAVILPFIIPSMEYKISLTP